MPRHSIDKGALAHSRRAGNADPPRRLGPGKQFSEQGVGPRPAVLDLAEDPGERTGGTRPHLLRDPLDLPAHPIFPQLGQRAARDSRL